jgi:hypothetical protein
MLAILDERWPRTLIITNGHGRTWRCQRIAPFLGPFQAKARLRRLPISAAYIMGIQGWRHDTRCTDQYWRTTGQSETAQRAFDTGDKAALTKAVQSGAVRVKAG